MRVHTTTSTSKPQPAHDERPSVAALLPLTLTVAAGRGAEPVTVRSLAEAFSRFAPRLACMHAGVLEERPIELCLEAELRGLRDFEMGANNCGGELAAVAQAAAYLRFALASYDRPDVAEVWRSESARARIRDALIEHVGGTRSGGDDEHALSGALSEIFAEDPVRGSAAAKAATAGRLARAVDVPRLVRADVAFEENVRVLRQRLEVLELLRDGAIEAARRTLQPVERAYHAINLFFAMAAASTNDPSEPSLVLLDINAFGSAEPLARTVREWLGKRGRGAVAHRPLLLAVPLQHAVAATLVEAAHEHGAHVVAQAGEAEDSATLATRAEEVGLGASDYLCMCWLKVRERAGRAGQDDVLFAPGSLALAARLLADGEALPDGAVLGAVTGARGSHAVRPAAVVAGARVVNAVQDAHGDLLLMQALPGGSAIPGRERTEASAPAGQTAARMSVRLEPVAGAVEQAARPAVIQLIEAYVSLLLTAAAAGHDNTAFSADRVDDYLFSLRRQGLLRRYRLAENDRLAIHVQVDDEWVTIHAGDPPLAS